MSYTIFDGKKSSTWNEKPKLNVDIAGCCAEQENHVQPIISVQAKKFTNTSVPTSTFVADETYTDYGYRAAIALTGVTAAMVADVMFGLEEAVSGKFAPISETYAGGVYIYASEIPEEAITIPTIIITEVA